MKRLMGWGTALVLAAAGLVVGAGSASAVEDCGHATVVVSGDNKVPLSLSQYPKLVSVEVITEPGYTCSQGYTVNLPSLGGSATRGTFTDTSIVLSSAALNNPHAGQAQPGTLVFTGGVVRNLLVVPLRFTKWTGINATPEPVFVGETFNVRGRIVAANWTTNVYEAFGDHLVRQQYRKQGDAPGTWRLPGVAKRTDAAGLAVVPRTFGHDWWTEDKSYAFRYVYNGSSLFASSVSAVDGVLVKAND